MPSIKKTEQATADRTDLKPIRKQDLAVGLLRRESGASLNELVEATGWLPHSTRAALTGLKKKGHLVFKEKREGNTFYSIRKGS